MTSDAVASILFEAVGIQVPTGRLNDEMLLAELGVDSLQVYELTVLIEEVTDVGEPLPSIDPSFRYVGDVRSYFEWCMESSATPAVDLTDVAERIRAFGQALGRVD